MLFFIIWGFVILVSLYFYANLKVFSGQIGFYYEEEPFTREQLHRFWEMASKETKGNIENIVLFRQEADIPLENQTLHRTGQTELVEVAGEMQLLLSGMDIYGSVPSDSDSSGCVISQKTAWEMFGSQNVLGERLVINGTSYLVRGILETNRNICVIQGDRGKQYSCLRVQTSNATPLSVTQEMLAGILPIECQWVSECDLYIGIGRLFFYIPLWILFFCGLSRAKRKTMWIKTKFWKDVWKITIPVLTFAGVSFLLVFSVHFSADYIPTMWSDFTFWTELFRQKTEAFWTLARSPLHMMDERMLVNLVGLMCSSIVGGIFCLGTRHL